ncbi:MAG: T9SS type A sorting domain-containing protein [Bacteroidota bacterium]
MKITVYGLVLILALSSSGILLAQEKKEWNWGNYGDSTFIPITVHLQSTSDIDAYQEAGINVYSGFWYGLTEQILEDLRAKKMHYIAAWDKHKAWPSEEMEADLVARANMDDPLFIAWIQKDEPDNAQPDGQGGYGPCMDPQVIIDRYNEIKAIDTTGRQVLLNCGAGVARTDAYIRGSCAGNTALYSEYYKGSDIASYDIYPVAAPPAPIATNDALWYVGEGVRNMRLFTGDTMDAYWFNLECTDIKGEGKPSPGQIWIEAWMGIVAGGTSLAWFPFTVYPNTHNSRALLEDPEMMAAVKKVNAALHDLAVVINTETRNELVDVELIKVNPWDIPVIEVDYMVKHLGDTLYIFTAGGQGTNPNTATFTLQTSGDAVVSSNATVLFEDREVEITNKQFVQEYTGQEIHLFKIGGITEDMFVGIHTPEIRSTGGYGLEQNYPNPFPGRTSIDFALPEAGLTTLRVFDLLGREVETLVDEALAAGSYSVDFDAGSLKEGIYIYRIRSNDFSGLRKMMVIK